MIAKLHTTDRILLEQAYIQIYTDKIYDENIYVEGFGAGIKNTSFGWHALAGAAHYTTGATLSAPIYYALGKAYCKKGEYIKALLCLVALIPGVGPIFKTLGFTTIMLRDWIKKTPMSETDSNQKLQSLCKKIFYFFDEEKRNKLNKLVDELGKELPPDKQEEFLAVMANIYPSSNPKEPPPLPTGPPPSPAPLPPNVIPFPSQTPPPSSLPPPPKNQKKAPVVGRPMKLVDGKYVYDPNPPPLVNGKYVPRPPESQKKAPVNNKAKFKYVNGKWVQVN